jgi:malate dehydrogenase (oxaloacetate-decarboxylating)
MKGNLVAVVSDGTAVLGLGNIGAKAAMPVMEGKALLFKSFADVDAFPLCLDTTDPDKIVEVVRLLEPTFGGVNLEDIAAPQCFDIEERLRKVCNIPIFHDDQHGTAIVTAAGLINALKLANKKVEDIRVVANGAGAAGVAIVKLLLRMGVKDVILCDTKGIIYEGRPDGMNPFKEEMARITNQEQKQGTLACNDWSGCVCRSIRCRCCHKRNSSLYESESDYFCHGESGSGNYATRCKRSWSTCSRDRPL